LWVENQNLDFASGVYSVYLNKYKRSVRCTGFLGANVQGGSSSLTLAAGMGDCLYLDFPKGFFAVADGSDRHTSASREFMKMFSQMLIDKISLSVGNCYTIEEINALKKQIIIEADRLLVQYSFRDSCTFTGVFLLRTTEKIVAIFFHTGDSLLISCNLCNKTAWQVTTNNFWMVGRSQHFFQIEETPVDEDTRFLLATDGIRDISPEPYNSQEELILRLFYTLETEAIPDHLSGMRRESPHGCDDLALIAIDPYSMPDQQERFIIGGTSINEERDFQEKKRQGQYQDNYILHTFKGEDAISFVL